MKISSNKISRQDWKDIDRRIEQLTGYVIRKTGKGSGVLRNMTYIDYGTPNEKMIESISPDLSNLDENQKTIVDILDDLELDFEVTKMWDNSLRIMVDHSKEIDRDIKSDLRNVDKRIEHLTGYRAVHLSTSTHNGVINSLNVRYDNSGKNNIFESVSLKDDIQTIVDILEDSELIFKHRIGVPKEVIRIETEVYGGKDNWHPLVKLLRFLIPDNDRLEVIRKMNDHPILRRIQKMTGYELTWFTISMNIDEPKIQVLRLDFTKK